MIVKTSCDCTYRLNLGCGDIRMEGFIGIDQYPSPATDIVRDLEKGLPFCDNSVAEIRVDSILEHIKDLQFFLNECWRVLHPEGILKGIKKVIEPGKKEENNK